MKDHRSNVTFMKRFDVILMWWSLFMVALMWFLITFFLAFPAKADPASCNGILDYSRRAECLAIERGSPADCLGVANYDQRQICRNRARRNDPWFRERGELYEGYHR